MMGCPYCEDNDDGYQLPDRAALSDFVAALLAGDVATARVYAGRAFSGEDQAEVERRFANHARTARAAAEAGR